MILLLFLYYLISAWVWGNVLNKILPLDRAWSKIFGFLVGFYLSAFAIGVPVVVWKYDRLSVLIAMLVVLVVGLLLSLRSKDKSVTLNLFQGLFWEQILKQFQHDVKKFGVTFAMTVRDKLVISFAIISALFIFLIFHARTGVYMLSPWDALSSFIIMLFFVICFIVVRMIFSRRSVGVVLAIIIIFSYITHAYLPVVYETGFGGDKWRHLGAEQWLQDGEIYTPSIWGEDRSIIDFGPVAVPEALVAGNKTSYAAQWSVTIMLSEALGVGLFWVDLLMVFLLWSLFLPLILYQFGKIILENERLGLLFAFLPTLFYTFQSEGAITIPVSFGHLFFFFVLLVWMYYVKQGKKSTLYFTSILSLVFYWGYILNFFLLILIGILSFSWRKLFVERKHWYKFKLKHGFSDKRLKFRDIILFSLIVICSIFIIPFLEIFQGLSTYAIGSLSFVGILDSFADAFGRLSGFIGIIVPPDYIDQGNFLYNQTKESLSRLPLFSYRAVPFIVSMFVWIFIWWAVYRLLRHSDPLGNIQGRLRAEDSLSSKKRSLDSTSEYVGSDRDDNKSLMLLAILFIITISSYFISWSFTEGVHILARRLNETIVFFMIIFLGYGIWFFLEDKRIKIPQRKKILAITFVLAFIATSTFASGPKLQLVTSDELEAARVVWAEHQNDSQPYCVIANTWPLLGLEAVSGRRITAGNFPVYAEYAQPERVKIFEGMSKAPSQNWIDGAFAVTDASICYYMTENRWINDRVLDKTVQLLGEPIRAGTVYIWRLEKK